MKQNKFHFRKIAIVAAAAIMVIGTGAFAGGKIVSYISSSSTIPTYTTLPTAQQMQKSYGFSPTILEKFSNGYQFKNVTTVHAKGLDENHQGVSSDKEADILYQKDNENFFMTVTKRASVDGKLAETYHDIAIYYNSYMNKSFPADYTLTEQDKKDEVSGKYVFSYGSDQIEVQKLQYLSWEKDGIYYSFCALDGSLNEQDFIQMAHEMIDAK